ncbi:MAG: 50S ribosomal protein L25, partial [Gammaproteobacteria bacterium]|nr:50S ribosomal protein L25 [Gammaproteobacteria bacterium]
MQQFLLNAELREDVGKGASRRLRHSVKLPGIIYGTKKEPMLISLQHNELIHQLGQEAFYSHILEVKIGKNTE